MSFNDMPDGQDDQQQAAPPATPAPPANPQQPAAQAQPPAQPQAPQNQQPTQPTPTSQTQQPADLHQSLFKNILETLSGGPVRQAVTDADGNPTTEVRHLSKRSLGASILAGALSSMVAGIQAPDRVDAFGHRDLSGSAEAGANAAQRNSPQARADQQTEKDNASRMAAYQVTDHNLKLHSLILGNTQLQGEVMKQGLALDAPIADAMRLSAPGAIKKQGVSEQELQKLMSDGSAHITRDSILRDGVTDVYDRDGKQVMNADGTPKQAYTYTIYDPTAMSSLTKELKDEYPEQLAGVPVGSQIPLRVFAKYALERGQLQNAEGFVQQWNEKSSEANPSFKAVNLQSAIKKDPYLRRLVPMLSRYAGKDPDQVLDEMEKDHVDPNLIGRFANLFQVDRAKMSQQRTAEAKKTADKQALDLKAAEQTQKENSTEGQLDLQNKRLDVKKKQQELLAGQSGAGIVVPTGYKFNPDTSDMSAADVQKDLEKQGVKVPSNFQALLAVAHNAADLKTLPPNPRKGSNQMSSQEGLGFIRQYLNPQYQEGDYGAASKLSAELASTRQGTAGGSLLSAGTAANHLELLHEASKALANSDVQGLNKLANKLGVAFGSSPAVTFKAIADQVNQEVGKVVAGGTPHEAELANLRENLNSDQSPEQVENVIRTYIGLMQGRISEIDERSQQYFGRHTKGVSPAVNRVFKKYGFEAIGGQAEGGSPKDDPFAQFHGTIRKVK